MIWRGTPPFMLAQICGVGVLAWSFCDQAKACGGAVTDGEPPPLDPDVVVAVTLPVDGLVEVPDPVVTPVPDEVLHPVHNSRSNGDRRTTGGRRVRRNT